MSGMLKSPQLRAFVFAVEEYGFHNASEFAQQAHGGRGYNVMVRLVQKSVFRKTGEVAMTIETIGNYQVHLIARPISASGPWVPYVEIDRFDENLQDFACIMERHRIGDNRVFNTEDEALEEARKYASSLLPAH